VTVARVAAALLAAPTPSPTPSHSTQAPSTACLNSDLCSFVYQKTGLGWLADTGLYLLVKPFRIVLIIVAALILRYVTHRLVRRLIRGDAKPERAGLWRPLRERMPTSLQEATGLRSERRRQRAEALSSVLQSIASVSIFAVATMLVLGELGVQLAPLIASAGVAGVALGFGAQNLVKDFIAGLFMLLEDQYGVGDVIDVGEASGTVEAVGLRITTIRDGRGVLWYIRNGEIVRVGNRSQGWALVVVDVPIGFAGVEEATSVLRSAASALAEDPEYAPDLLEAPAVLGVEQITVDGAVVRTTMKTASEKQWSLARELRRRLTEALESAGITAHITGTRGFVRPRHPSSDSASSADPGDHGVGGAT
jgi:small-conductance mechanosensitive channel